MLVHVTGRALQLCGCGRQAFTQARVKLSVGIHAEKRRTAGKYVGVLVGIAAAVAHEVGIVEHRVQRLATAIDGALVQVR